MSRYVVQAGWDHVPHLTEQDIEDLSKSIAPHQREARMNGTPSLGSGAIFPVPEQDIVVEPFQIPAWYPRAYGFDVGWNRTAAVWGAHDRDTDTIYLYSEHYRGQAEVPIHAKAIRMRGDWIPGIIDTAARGRSQADGRSLWSLYDEEGLILHKANKGVESGLMEMLDRLSTGRLKVFSTLQHWLAEYRLYRRDEKGRVVKENDHCLHPDTMVITRQGKKRIADMAGTTGEILTVGGFWANYENCRMTARNQCVLKVEFEDGGSVICTPDHRFLTPQGWIEARAMTGIECYNAVTQSIQRSQACESPLFPTRFKNFAVNVITSAARTFKEMALDCIGLCGSKKTQTQCPMGGMYTTKITTSTTTSQRIWNWWQPLSTYDTIKMGTTGGFLVAPLRLQGYGTEAMLVANGTKSTTNATKKNFTSSVDFPASNAGKNSQRLIVGSIVFAQTNAKRVGAKNLGLMTKLANALNVAGRLLPTNTPRSKRAAENAKVRCLGVSDAGESDVYCLTVPETAAFAVESGVVVHNCMDATRYLCMGIHHAEAKPRGDYTPSVAGDPTAGY